MHERSAEFDGSVGGTAIGGGEHSRVTRPRAAVMPVQLSHLYFLFQRSTLKIKEAPR
jgi:hypothetical protein